MGLINETIPNMINGVSQQPSALRLPSQGEAQVNALSSVVEGLIKRPPAKHLDNLSATAWTEPFTHLIDRDADEKYIVVVLDNEVKVFDLEGTEKTVNVTADADDYLDTSTPRDSIAALTLADTTFLLNREVKPAMDSTTSTAKVNEAIIEVKSVSYTADYKVDIDGVEKASYTTADSEYYVQTQLLADELATDLDTELGAGWTVTRSDSVIHIVKDDGTAFETEVHDPRSGTQLSLITNGTTRRFSDLPHHAPDGTIVEIVGDGEEKADNYFVKFATYDSGISFGNGVWEECVAPGAEYILDPETMPQTLTRESDGTFTLAAATWGQRSCGDATTNPDPSFVGQTVNNLTFFKNRLGLMAEENLIFSRSGEYFEFFRETMTTVLDSDVVDVTANFSQVNILRAAIPFNEQLLVFSDQAQFIFDGGELLTPSTASLTLTTTYESVNGASPVGVGRNVFFPTNKGAYSGVREYFIQPESDSNDAADVSAHIPAYIEGDIIKMVASSSADVLAVLADEDQSVLYVYKYYWQGDDKLQSSWSKFTFTGDILSMEFEGTVLYLVVQYDADDEVYLESLDFAPGQSDTGETYLIHLDRRVDDDACTGPTYTAGTNTTKWVLPYDTDTEPVVVIKTTAEDMPPVGTVLDTTFANDNELTVEGDLTTTEVYIGVPYEMRYTFSEAVLRKQTPKGATVPVLTGRLQLKRWSVAYSDSGFFTVEVTPVARDTWEYDFSSRVLGTADNQTGEIVLKSGVFRFPVQSVANQVTIELVNDTHLPSSFLNAAFEALYVSQSAGR